MSSFKDHFSGHASQYGKFRPTYPGALYRYLASISPATNRAWDCATGSGQAALGLAKYFREVIASDASQQQIQQCTPHDHIHYITATAENSGIESTSIDLVTVAQALHWFDLDKFYTEAKRVLVPGGILSAWTYSLFRITPAIDKIIFHLYHEILSEYWPPERVLVENAYRDIVFPFEEISAPEFHMETEWNLDQVLGYLRTWSAVQAFISKNQQDPVDMIYETLSREWGEAGFSRTARWPLSLKTGRHNLA